MILLIQLFNSLHLPDRNCASDVRAQRQSFSLFPADPYCILSNSVLHHYRYQGCLVCDAAVELESFYGVKKSGSMSLFVS